MDKNKSGRPNRNKRFVEQNPARITVEVGTKEYRKRAAFAVRKVSGLDMSAFIRQKLDEAIAQVNEGAV